MVMVTQLGKHTKEEKTSLNCTVDVGELYVKQVSVNKPQLFINE